MTASTTRRERRSAVGIVAGVPILLAGALNILLLVKYPASVFRPDEGVGTLVSKVTWVAACVAAVAGSVWAFFGSRIGAGIAAGGAAPLVAFGLQPIIADLVKDGGTDLRLLAVGAVLGAVGILVALGAFGGASHRWAGAIAALCGIGVAVLATILFKKLGEAGLPKYSRGSFDGKWIVFWAAPALLCGLVALLGGVAGRGGAAAAATASALHLPFAVKWITEDAYTGLAAERWALFGCTVAGAVFGLVALSRRTAPEPVAVVSPPQAAYRTSEYPAVPGEPPTTPLPTVAPSDVWSHADAPTTVVEQWSNPDTPTVVADVWAPEPPSAAATTAADAADTIPIAVSNDAMSADATPAGGMPADGGTPAHATWAAPRPGDAVNEHPSIVQPAVVNPLEPAAETWPAAAAAAAAAASEHPAQWAPDPHGRHELRYWDGTSWTRHVADGGVQSVEPG